MYLFRVFRSFLPIHNPIGFGAADFVVLALAVLLAVLLLAISFAAPYAREISKRTFPCMFLLFSLAIALRLALLPVSSVPIPSGADDFSYLLLGDTLTHLRLANPTHPLHQFFEAVFVLQEPTYASIYPLGQGLALAVGGVGLQSYWAGALVSDAAFCALCYWMLRAWVAPLWAFAGGLLAIIEFGPLNPWVNSYWGGAVSACAGCLVFGSLPRVGVSPRKRYGILLGAGLGLQIITRPFEAVFLTLAALVYLLLTFHRDWLLGLKAFLAVAAVVTAALGLTLLQNKAVTGSFTTMPYMLSRYQYGVPATLTIQSNAVPHRQMTAEQELDYRAQAAIHGPGTDSVPAYFKRLAYRLRFLRFFLLPPLYFAIMPFLRILREWRYAWAAGTILLFVLGTNLYPFFYPHYIAAATCLFVAIGIQGLQALASTSRRLITILCGASFIFWYGLYLSGDKDLLSLGAYQSWNYVNRGDPQGRAAVAEKLAHSPGEQLVFVRYSLFHKFEEWIHNAADIDSAQTVWANDMGVEENQKLVRYYPHRTVWLLEPDVRPPSLTRYAPSSPPFQTVH